MQYFWIISPFTWETFCQRAEVRLCLCYTILQGMSSSKLPLHKDSPSLERAEKQTFVFIIPKLLSSHTTWQLPGPEVQVRVYTAACVLSPGDRVSIKNKVQALRWRRRHLWGTVVNSHVWCRCYISDVVEIRWSITWQVNPSESHIWNLSQIKRLALETDEYCCFFSFSASGKVADLFIKSRSGHKAWIAE